MPDTPENAPFTALMLQFARGDFASAPGLPEPMPAHPGRAHVERLELAYDGEIPRDTLRNAEAADRAAHVGWLASLTPEQREIVG